MTADQRQVGDAFAFRSGERVRLLLNLTESPFAVMAAPVPALPQPSRATCLDGAPVEQCCIVAAALVAGDWQWMQLAPTAKEVVGDMIFDHGLEHGRWYGLLIGEGRA